MGAEQMGSPLHPLPRGERWEKIPVRKPKAAFDPPWEDPGEHRGLVSSDGVWGYPVGFCPATSQEGMGCNQMNPFAVCTWR